MIVIDSSAILAILFAEPESKTVEAVMVADDECIVSAVNAHETIVVLRSRRGEASIETFFRLVEDLGIEIVDFDLAQVHEASLAFNRYGKGINSKAKLNLCDCAAYALAKSRNVPLLFKGDDFSHTDIVPAV